MAPPTAAFAVFGIVFAARAMLVAARGSPLPYLDSWEALFEHALVPWIENGIGPSELLHPHFEHTLVWTKLLAWAATWLGGGTWHNIAFLYVNAALYAGALAIVAGSIVPGLSGNARWAFASALALLGSIPYGWANGLWELQNCWFILVGLTALALRGALAVPGSRSARIGFAAGLALPFTMAVGALSVTVALAARAVSAWRTIPSGADRMRAVTPWVVSTAVAWGFVASVKIGRPPSAMSPTTDSVGHALTLLLSWPLEGSTAVAVAAYLPWAALSVWMLARPDADRARQFTIALGAWHLCVLLGFSLARSAEISVAVPHRYKELLALGAAMNVACLLCLAAKIGRGTGAASGIARLLLWGWILAVVSIVTIAGFNPEPIASRTRYQHQMRENIRDYYATGDQRLLSRGDPVPFPYASPARFAALLDRPGTRQLLNPIVSAP